ncbi:MAG: DUF2064 domain-containing protein [Flavobacteriaceae bacterium]|nr:DUF2064 domain-containing protein [Flavobacteriaceae bacterium]
MNRQTAVLIFANSSQGERKFKSFAKGDAFVEELNENILQTVKKSKLPYYLFTEKEQVGKSFGERFSNAIQAVFEKGFESVITVGNDTPQLRKHHILQAANEIDKNKCVVGPSIDGGFYLMGLSRKQFGEISFLDLPWQTKSLEKTISFQIEATQTEVIKLDTLLDVDSASDLKELVKLSQHISGKLLSILSSLLNANVSISLATKLLIGRQEKRNYFNKGSPEFLAI